LKAGFPVRLLPKVIEAGKMAGTLAHRWHVVQVGVPVTAAMGDLQCYVLSKLQSDDDAGMFHGILFIVLLHYIYWVLQTKLRNSDQTTCD